ncbi:MAG: Kelch repeat-containing protein [Brevinema sp.]
MKKVILLFILLTSCEIRREQIKLGVKWTRIDKSNFVPRRNFGTAVIGKKIVVMGGYILKNGREELANDVWISEDQGKNWQEIKTNTASPTDTFTKRQKFGTAVIGNKIFIIGGYSDSGGHLNDVCESSDCGRTWTEVMRSASFSARYGHQVVVLENDLFVIGGTDGANYFNDVWRSKDFGRNWEPVSGIPFEAREGFGAISYQDEMLILGGNNRNGLTDLWRSEGKGSIWYKEPNLPFEFYEQSLVKVKNDLFVVEQDHVWKSINEGLNWDKILFEADFGARTGFGMVNIGKKLILFGGYNPNSREYLNDVWESEY